MSVVDDTLGAYEELVLQGRAARRSRRWSGRTADRTYPSEDTCVCAICHIEFPRPSRMGPRPRTCSKRCAATLSKRIARHGPGSPLVNQDYSDRKCAFVGCDEGLPPTARSDAHFCSGRCRVAAHRSRAV